MIDEPTAEQKEQWRQAELVAQERDRRQAVLDYWVELRRAAGEEDRRNWRELRESLDPFNYGHWRGDW